MRGEIPGFPGIVGLIAALIGTCTIITVQSGMIVHWFICGASIVVSLWAVKAVNQ